MNDFLRNAAGRSGAAPQQAEPTEAEIDDVAAVMGLTATEARDWLLSSPRARVPAGNAGSGTGGKPPKGRTAAEAVNRAIRILTGRAKQ